MFLDKPDLVKRFLAATKEAFEWANANPEEACKLHVARFPEVELDDCMASVRAVMPFVFNDHSKASGWGKESADRLKFSWETIATANDLKKDYDYKQAIDTKLVPAK
jgi:NitT/TauT family transport system substrate-binding protein